MKTLKFTLSLFILLAALAGNLSAASPERLYQDVRDDYVALLGSSQAQRQRHNWLNVAAKLEKLATSGEAAHRTDDARFLLGRTWHGLAQASGRSDDARQAITIYEELAEDFPNSNLADDALIYAAEISLETFSDQTSAYNYYLKITSVLPPGDMLGEAQLRLKRLAVSAPTDQPTGRTESSRDTTGGGFLDKVRVWSSPEYTRVVLDLSRSASYEPHRLAGADPRVYVDLDNFQVGGGVESQMAVGDGLVSQIRSGQLDEKRVRVVLDLEHDGDFQAFSLSDPDRIVIDVRRAAGDGKSSPATTGKVVSRGNDSIAGLLDGVEEPPQLLHVPQQNGDEGIRLIVVDAGHGGKDPGAVGRNNTKEKDVTLQMAKRLAATLRKELGCKVLLTRNDDRYLKLQDRTAYANKVGADLFISLHANASPNRRAYGLETYYLNLSKNNQAAEVAARENNTSLEEVSNLEAILFDLMANAKINESSRLAAEIQQSMVSHLKPNFSNIKDLGVRQGPFHVLLGATMPSVLVEAAFISNSREEKRLKDPDYQQRIAQAIVRGVKEYRDTLEQVARR